MIMDNTQAAHHHQRIARARDCATPKNKHSPEARDADLGNTWVVRRSLVQRAAQGFNNVAAKQGASNEIGIGQTGWRHCSGSRDPFEHCVAAASGELRFGCLRAVVGPSEP